jgi:hypothetical protein
LLFLALGDGFLSFNRELGISTLRFLKLIAKKEVNTNFQKYLTAILISKDLLGI